MSLPSRPSLEDIKGEFGSQTLNNLTQQGFREFYEKVISASSSGGESVHFGGLGKPELSSFSVATGDGTIEADCFVNTNDLSTTYYIQYQENTGSVDPNNWSFSGTSSTGSSGTRSRTVSVPEGDYYVRFVAYNNFNDAGNQDEHSTDHTKTSTVSVTVEFEEQNPVISLSSGINEITINLDESTAGPYEILRSTSSPARNGGTIASGLTTNDFPYTDTNVSSGVTYYYEVQDGNGNWSNEVFGQAFS